MADENDSLESIVPPQALHPHERALIDRLLQEPFEGSVEVRSQLSMARVEAEGAVTRARCASRGTIRTSHER